jgi:hypothetical protein
MAFQALKAPGATVVRLAPTRGGTQAEWVALPALLARRARRRRRRARQTFLLLLAVMDSKRLSDEAAARLERLNLRQDEAFLRSDAANSLRSTLQEGIQWADGRRRRRLRFVRETLRTADAHAYGPTEADRRLTRRAEALEALHQHEQFLALKRWTGQQSEETLRAWDQTERDRMRAQAGDPCYDRILAASEGEPERQGASLKKAKSYYLRLVNEVTDLVEEARHLNRASAASHAERELIDRNARGQTARLAGAYFERLAGKRLPASIGRQGDAAREGETQAYRAATDALEAARPALVENLKAARRKLAAAIEGQLRRLAAPETPCQPQGEGETAGGRRPLAERAQEALTRRDPGALALIRRELEQLFDLAEKAKESPGAAVGFLARERQALNVMGAAAAHAQGSLEAAPARGEAAKAIGAALEWDDALETTARPKAPAQEGPSAPEEDGPGELPGQPRQGTSL